MRVLGNRFLQLIATKVSHLPLPEQSLHQPLTTYGRFLAMRTKLLCLVLCCLPISAYAKPQAHIVKIITAKRITTYVPSHCWFVPCEEMHVVINDDGTIYGLEKGPMKNGEDYSWLHDRDEITIRRTKLLVFIQQGNKWRTFRIVYTGDQTVWPQ